MPRLPVLTWIGNAVAVLLGQHGDVTQQAQKASQVLAVLDRHTRPAAVDLCADEIFFHGTPVLVGVEPFSMALLLCRRAVDRTGVTWHEALKPFTALEYAACDQGKGLLAGLK